MKMMYAICKHNRIETPDGVEEHDEYMHNFGEWKPIKTRYHNWSSALLFHDKHEAECVADDLCRFGNIIAFVQWVNVYGKDGTA